MIDIMSMGVKSAFRTMLVNVAADKPGANASKNKYMTGCRGTCALPGPPRIL